MWNGRLVFTATDGVYGHELRTLVDVNGAPNGADGLVTILHDAVHTLMKNDFAFTDPTDSPGNEFAAVKIETLPSSDAGNLLLGDTPVAAGQIVSLFAIESGSLRFFSAVHISSDTTASFAFRVQDNGGTEHGGVDFDGAPNTLTITVVGPYPWHNQLNVLDVSNDGAVALDDALRVINYLNAHGSTPVSPTSSDGNFYDVSADNFVSPIDALLIFNQLNASLAVAGEGEHLAESESAAH